MRKAVIRHSGLEPGQIVISTAGHDRGKFYIVIRTEADGAWLADGRIRTLDRPKFKKRKHIQKTLTVFHGLPDADGGMALTDASIFKAIKAYASKL